MTATQAPDREAVEEIDAQAAALAARQAYDLAVQAVAYAGMDGQLQEHEAALTEHCVSEELFIDYDRERAVLLGG